MSPENTHKLMGFYMEVLILGVVLQYIVSASVSYRVYRVKLIIAIKKYSLDVDTILQSGDITKLLAKHS